MVKATKVEVQNPSEQVLKLAKDWFEACDSVELFDVEEQIKVLSAKKLEMLEKRQAIGQQLTAAAKQMIAIQNHNVVSVAASLSQSLLGTVIKVGDSYLGWPQGVLRQLNVKEAR